jgi:hypothetical protein
MASQGNRLKLTKTCFLELIIIVIIDFSNIIDPDVSMIPYNLR